MALKEDLAALKARLESGRPADALAMMHRAVDELRTSGAERLVLRVGDRAPRFSLPDATEALVDSERLLEQGPLVVTFYRGRW